MRGEKHDETKQLFFDTPHTFGDISLGLGSGFVLGLGLSLGLGF